MGLWCASRGALSAAGLLLFKGARSVTRVRGVPVRACSGDSSHSPPVCHQLPHRALLRLHGADTRAFLQGLVTNDVTLLSERAALYAHLLNVQGRTLYDVILYRFSESDGGDGVYLECDATMTDSLVKHLKTFKIRRKVSISPCPEVSVWAVLCSQSKPELTSPDQAVAWEPDPRTALMGRRLLLHRDVRPSGLIPSCQEDDTEKYHMQRYSLGVPEGVRDLPPGVALPLESNLVYLQGISFSKGCYIGQELTARTHHTGVVRKRLMPVRLSSALQDSEDGAALQTVSGKPAGKHRASMGRLGLSLVRTAHAKETLTLQSSDGVAVTLEASVPPWWPREDS
ncbi:putative transferase CAF17 homolog, mitochondrial [Gouania willdenowi]|uniref:Iron-sulfur cluster assembly factor IBA57, mitochondrial n=1 Tax=Gouania willdenowi TaxID=441366 RepID=A0A8C5EU41_GOUWI|nr:putative transferase CAF17, mitochondrial [Gouania willdenowi]